MKRRFTIALLCALAITWGHDGATLAAKALAPKSVTWNQLLQNGLNLPHSQHVHAVAEPYWVGPMKVVEE